MILIKESLNRAKVNLESYRSSLDSGKLENVICELYHCRIMYPTVNKKNIIEEVDLTTLMRVISIMKSNKYDLYGLDDLDKGLNLLEKDIYSLDGFSYLEFFVNKNLH